MTSQLEQSCKFEMVKEDKRNLEKDNILLSKGDEKIMTDYAMEFDKLQTYAKNLPNQFYIDYSDKHEVGENDNKETKAIKSKRSIDEQYDGLIGEMGDLERELIEMQANLKANRNSGCADNYAIEEKISEERDEAISSDASDEVDRSDPCDEEGLGSTSIYEIDARRGSYVINLIENANKCLQNRRCTQRMRRSSSLGDLRDLLEQNRSIHPANLSRNSLSMSSENVSELVNTDLYQRTNDNNDGDDNDDKKTELFREKTNAKKSISVDLCGDEEKPNFRRNGLNFGNIDRDDDYIADLHEFKKLYKEKGRGKTSGLRIARSVENLTKWEKTSFLKKKLLKCAKVFETTQEEGFRSYISGSKDDLVEEVGDEDLGKKFGGSCEMYIDAKGNLIRKVEIHKIPNQSLGFFIRFGNGIDRDDGIFISRVTLGSLVDDYNLLHTGDEIITINDINVSDLTLKDVASIMQKSTLLVMDTQSALPLQHAAPLLGQQVNHGHTVNQVDEDNRRKRDQRTQSDPSKGKLDDIINMKTRSFTEVKNDDSSKSFLKTNQSKGLLGSPKFLKRKRRVTEENEIFSSSSDSEEILSNESQAVTYPSDSVSIASKLGRKFTGKLAVDIVGVSGVSLDESDSCYCSIDVNNEFKAKTLEKKVEKFVRFNENFDIDVQEANFVTIHVYQKQGRKDIILTNGCIRLGKLLANSDKADLSLVTFNDKIQIRVNIEYIAAELYLHRRHSRRMTGVFGFNLSQTLVNEMNTIPIIVRKCVEEIELRGLDIEGIYRISGNARKKKILRHQFEKNSSRTNISRDDIDCHVITGTLKDYLRELPSPLISQDMYTKIAETYVQKATDGKSQKKNLSEIIKMVAYTNRATLIYIMDHLRRVAARSEINKMDCKNLAVCFGPVMMCPPTITEMQNFKKQIDALEYLLVIWPDSTKQNLI